MFCWSSVLIETPEYCSAIAQYKLDILSPYPRTDVIIYYFTERQSGSEFIPGLAILS